MRGLYASSQGMIAGMERVDIISHNLANAGTTAFKGLGSTMRSFTQELSRLEVRPSDGKSVSRSLGSVGMGTLVDQVFVQMEPGALRRTDNDLEAAIEDDGFFVVETADAQEAYTRDGRFLVDADGYLTTLAGQRVLGRGGAIQVGNAAAVRLSAAGEVWSGNQVVDRLRAVEFAEPHLLQPQGAHLYRLPEEEEMAEPREIEARLAVGYVEESNVNVMREMAALIAATREYEANQRVIATYDETLGKTVNEVGRV